MTRKDCQDYTDAADKVTEQENQEQENVVLQTLKEAALIILGFLVLILAGNIACPIQEKE